MSNHPNDPTVSDEPISIPKGYALVKEEWLAQHVNQNCVEATPSEQMSTKTEISGHSEKDVNISGQERSGLKAVRGTSETDKHTRYVGNGLYESHFDAPKDIASGELDLILMEYGSLCLVGKPNNKSLQAAKAAILALIEREVKNATSN